MLANSTRKDLPNTLILQTSRLLLVSPCENSGALGGSYIPGEFSGEVGRDFVNKVSLFFDDNFGFSVVETAYEGSDAASISVGDETVKFDLIMKQKRRFLQGQETSEYRVHFFCECKSRTNPRDLKGQLKVFIEKALKVTPVLQNRFSDNFRFVFICNKPFGIGQESLESIENLRDLLNDDHGADDLRNLSERIGILVLTDWFLETVLKRGT